LISEAFWARRFARSSGVIGTSISLDGHPFTVAGVMKPGFAGISLDFPVDVWVPIDAQSQLDGVSSLDDRGLNWVRVIARVGDSSSVERVQAAANLVAVQTRTAGVALLDSTERLALIGAAQPIARDRGRIERTLYVALALASLVLLIACANVANLQFARSAARRREIAVRLALGAGRVRLVRQLLTESLTLALLGGMVGLGIAFALGRIVSAFAVNAGLGPTVGALVGSVVNAHTLLFTAALAFIAALGFGLLPAARSSRVDVTPELRQSGFSIVRGVGGSGVNALLGAQLAMSVVLLISALTVSNELRVALSVDLGFRPDGLLQVSADWRGMSDAAARADATSIAAALESMPGVVAASVSAPAGFGRPTASTKVFIAGATGAQGKPTTVEYQVVAPEFFSAMGISVLRGRAFADEDRAGAELVTMVNETAARELFAGRAVVGERVALFGLGRRVSVVGVVHDSRLHSPTDPAPAVVYVPLAQDPGAAPTSLFTVEVHAGQGTLSPKEIGRRIAAVDSHLKTRVQPVSELVRESLAVERLTAWATGAFGIVGMLLAMIGVYGLHAYVVSRRTTELGIRLALGATRARVLWDVWRHGMRPVLGGAMFGLVAAVLSAVWLHGAHRFSLADARIALFATIVLSAVAAAACYVPARTAAMLDPARTLRSD
jgi:predicted permease